MRLVPNVPDKLMPFVMLLPVIFSPSVTVTCPDVAVSLFARSRREETIRSVPPDSPRAIRPAVSVLPATLVFCTNCKSNPVIDPVVTAVPDWILVGEKRFALQAVLAPELLEE